MTQIGSGSYGRNKDWAKQVSSRRKRIPYMTRWELAMRAGIDASYVTLIQRDGYVPSRDKVVAVAEALNWDTNEALLVAGYAPDYPLELLLGCLDEWQLEQLAGGEFELFNEARHWVPADQDELALGLRGFISVVLAGAPSVL